MKKELDIDFLPNRPLGILHIYSSEFSTGQSTSEFFFLILCEAVP